MVVETCVMLHNMMVAERISRDEEEGTTWYEYGATDPEDADDGNNEDDGAQDPDEEFIECQEAELNLHRLIEQALLGPGEAGNLHLEQLRNNCRFLTLHQQ